MDAKTSFFNGLKLDLPDGTQRRLPACQWHDDPLYVIRGRSILKFDRARDSEPSESEGLPIGTVVRRWDEDNGDPVIGAID